MNLKNRQLREGVANTRSFSGFFGTANSMISLIIVFLRQKWGVALFGISILVAWELVVRIFHFRPVVLPGPLKVLQILLLNSKLIYRHMWPTIWQCLLGFVSAGLAGVALGIMVVYSGFFRRSVLPYIVAFQVLPKIAFAPLFIIWFGVGSLSSIVMTFFISFFPMVIDTATGLETTDSTLISMARAFGASEWQIFSTVRFPHALPFIFSGLKVSITLAVIGIIVGEFVSSQEGLGYLILFAQGSLDTPLVMATLLVLGGIGLCLYGIFLLLEKHLIYWEKEQEKDRVKKTVKV